MVARLKDVASQAGVSIKTVSNVVNGYEHVSDATRRRVMVAVAELGYRPNMAARYLRRARLRVIALEVPALHLGYFTELAEHAAAAAEEHGFMLLLDHTGGRHASEQRLVRGLRPTLIDGAILNPLSLRAQELVPDRTGVPIVLIGERRYGMLHDHVAMDNVAAARAATAHLIEIGRRRIATVGLSRSRRAGDSIQLRWEGFAGALRDAGLSVPARWVQPGVDRGRRDGLDGVRRILARGPLPDAIFCFNDIVAMGVLRGLREAGARVPEDVAVVGVDDIEEGRYSSPSLSTVAPDKARIARVAVDVLVGRITGARRGPGEMMEVGFRLRVRESTAGGTIPA